MFDLIVRVLEATGGLGVAFLMFAENVFPPIPSELIMPLAGFSAASGTLNVWVVLTGGIAGSLAGAVLWYYVGVWLGAERLKRWAARHGRWLTLSPADIDRASDWFRRRGGMAVFVGRLVPGVRTLISVPAGVAGMPMPAFLLWSALGTAIWTGLLTAAGYLLEDQYERVATWIDPMSTGVVVLLVLGYLYRVATFQPDEPA